MRSCGYVDSAAVGLGVGTGPEAVPFPTLDPTAAYLIETAPQAPLDTITHIKVDAWSVAGFTRTGQGVVQWWGSCGSTQWGQSKE